MLLVEDGSGVVGAESYLDASSCLDYWADHGFTWTGDDPLLVEAALRRATIVLEGAFRTRWPGRQPNAGGVRQALSWPRVGAYDLSGIEIDADAIPRELLAASAELARREIVTPYSLSPDMTTQRVLSESVAGAISVTYADLGDQRPVVLVVNDLLSGLVRFSSSGFYARG